MQQTNTITTYQTQLNNLGIYSVVLDAYNREYIQILKNDNFRYFSKTKQWSKPGFNNLDQFNNYLIALFNHDTKMIKKLQPKKDEIIKQCITLKKAGFENKKKYINERNEQKINELLKVFDNGSVYLLLEYCKNKKLDFWSMTPDNAKKIIIENTELQHDIIEYNKQNNITNNTTWINDIFNDGLPF